MNDRVFTFWEGYMPAYIKMCMKTWEMPYTVLTYDNLREYTDLPVDARLKRFTLPKIADAVRVHVLRDQGGYWLDADTIIMGELPTTNMIGYPEKREQTIGYLYAPESGMDFFKEWAQYQDLVLNDQYCSDDWSVMGNVFTDSYVKEHGDITIAPVTDCWPETYMIDKGSRYDKYHQFYFIDHYELSDIHPTNMLMLHNSWTPGWYKAFSEQRVLGYGCTLSNILRERLKE